MKAIKGISFFLFPLELIKDFVFTSRYAGEIHLVHYSNKYKDLSQALTVGRVAVLGVFLYVSCNIIVQLFESS